MKRSLVCSRSERKRFLTRAEQAIDAFLEDHPDADFEKWHELLGTPEEFAAHLMDECDICMLKQTLEKRISYITFGSVLLAIILLFSIILVYYHWKNDGYVEVRTREYVNAKYISTPQCTSHIEYFINEDGSLW
ncbi:hypothetical protein [Pseudoflavonifractor phocaeensis]|uniref:hypothetical protein n=1 Tax=Pseudoflavonifractor phocaeensis TaxID=1870988 RepID=UPI00195D8C37|nr:hypothetical protein [Pseudoflavonifractor phocaeensis]MBM6871080.1 hypothetical protein [Pseudoflavonifractor phocaeensis]